MYPNILLFLFYESSLTKKISLMNYNLPIGMGGGNSTYSAPAIEVIDIATEKGFATSPQYGDEGNAGADPSDNDYGDY